jgi:hypothetical protein
VLIKAADPNTSVTELTALLRRRDLPLETRPWIARELKTEQRGRRGERQAQYEIEFHFGQRPDVVTLHGFRVDCAGRVAQIDHLILTRYLDIWLCESKAISGRIHINEYGEWEAAYGHRSYGMKSPYLQAWNHLHVLADVFARKIIPLPDADGVMLKPTYHVAVLLSDSARITRPVSTSDQLEAEVNSVMKVERLYATFQRKLHERESSGGSGQQISCEALVAFAKRLTALHAPKPIDWAAKFGLVSPASASEAAAATENIVRMTIETCASCGVRLRHGEVEYCRDQARAFAGALYCMRCQPKARAQIEA